MQYLSTISILLYCFGLSLSTLATEKLDTKDWNIEINEKKYRVFTKGTEFYFLYLEEFKDNIWAYTYVLNKEFAGKYAWLPVAKERVKFRFYAADKEQSFQTMQLSRATYIRNYENVGAYLNQSNKREINYEKIKQYMSKYSDTYPITTLTKNKEETLKQEMNACPKKPKRLKNKFCSEVPNAYKLPKHLVRALNKTAKRFKLSPALLAAIIHKESEFNPFSENEYEKNLCLKNKKTGEKCADYLWGQGLAQLGANNAKDYGILWSDTMPKIKLCNKRKHIFSSQCFYSLERVCKRKYKKYKLWPSYCPTASMEAIAKNIQKIKSREHKILIKTNNINKIVDLRKHMQRNKAEEIRYTLGIYNRGMKPVNSIEEYYRQYNVAPPWYGYAWKTKRIAEETPSAEIGFLLLHNEIINRCHVWQLAGLCGESLKGSLVYEYEKYLSKYNRIIADKNSSKNP